MALPSNVGYGLVVGRLVRSVIDNTDPGNEPDVVPIQGATIDLVPGVLVAKHLGSDPTPVTIFFEPIKASTDEDGYLVNPNTGERGIRVVATDDEDLVPSLGFYTVTWSGAGIQKTSWRIAVPEGSTVDLTIAAPVPTNVSASVVEWKAVRNQVLAARDEAVAAVGSIGMPSEAALGVHISNYLTNHSIETTTVWSSVLNKPLTFPATAHAHPWAEITDKPEMFPPSTHAHAWDDVLSKPVSFPPENHSHEWSAIESKPTEFTPVPHNHDGRYYTKTETDGLVNDADVSWDDITNRPATFNASPHTHGWSQIDEKPAAFPSEPHTHDWNQITSKPASYIAAPHAHDWADISTKPDVYPPAAHDHNTLYYTQAQVDAIVQMLVVGDTEFEFSSEWSDIVGKPTAFPPAEHNHDTQYYTQNQVDDLIAALLIPETEPPVISSDWADITNKPGTFDPAVHDHDDLYFTKTLATEQLLSKVNTTNTLVAASGGEILSLEIQDDNTSTDGWVDRLTVRFKRFADGVSRRVQWWNEYGEWRGAPAKASTVGWRIFTKEQASDPDHQVLVPVMEMQDNRTSRLRRWALMTDGTQQGPGGIPLAYTIVLAAGAPVPSGLPVGTIIYRKTT